MGLFTSSRFQGMLKTINISLPQHEHVGSFNKVDQDEAYIRNKGMFYLATATTGYDYSPVTQGVDFYKLHLNKTIREVLPRYPELIEPHNEADVSWKRAEAYPNASMDNVSRFPSYPQGNFTLSSEIREGMNFAFENLLPGVEKIIPLSTGAVLSDSSMLKNTACGMEVRRCFRKRAHAESGEFDSNRPRHFVKRTYGDGTFNVRSKKDAYYTYYYTFKDRGRNFHTLKLFPATLGYRRQVSKRYKNKLRTMMIPSDDVILEEARYVLPFIRKVATSNSPILTFSEHIETSISPFIRDSLDFHSRKFGSPVSIDYSAWDTTLSQMLLAAAYEVFFSYFDIHKVQSVDGKIHQLMENSVERARKLVRYIINTPILLPVDAVTGKSYVVRKFGGMPSGCMTTNIIGSICNAIMTCVAVRRQAPAYPIRLKVQGDDTLLYPPCELNLSDYSDVVSEYGLIVHEDKCAHFDRDGFVTYLGHEFCRETVSRQPVKTFASLLYTERSVTNYADCVLRVLSLFSAEHILAGNSMASMLFEVFNLLGGKEALKSPEEQNALRYARYFFKEYYLDVLRSPDEFLRRKREMLVKGGTPLSLCLYPKFDYFNCGYILSGAGIPIKTRRL